MFFMLASGSTNYLQKTSIIDQFSTKNAKKHPKTGATCPELVEGY